MDCLGEAPLVTEEPCFDAVLAAADEPHFDAAPLAAGGPPCFDSDALPAGELQAALLREALQSESDWSSMGREELRLIHEALQRAEQPTELTFKSTQESTGREELRLIHAAVQRAEQPGGLGDSALTAAAQHGLGDLEPALIAAGDKNLAEPDLSAERHARPVVRAPGSEGESRVGVAPSASAGGLLQDHFVGNGAFGELSPPNPLLAQTRDESGRSLPLLPAQLLAQHLPPNQHLPAQQPSQRSTYPPPPACRSFPSPSLPSALNPSTAFMTHKTPAFMPTFGTKRRLLAAQISSLADMDAFQARKRLCDNPVSVDSGPQGSDTSGGAAEAAGASKFRDVSKVSSVPCIPLSPFIFRLPCVPFSERLEALKAVIPAEVLLRQQVSAGGPQGSDTSGGAVEAAGPGKSRDFSKVSSVPCIPLSPFLLPCVSYSERLEALKAVIPAEVLLRQQGRAGFSNRTQIATLLDAAVGFIEGMRQYKLELQRQLLAP
ncbi:unnamed protein product [Closterium sp. Yama58-4]|nr:unnamed protein product [Closterium sp. Yama58-4]